MAKKNNNKSLENPHTITFTINRHDKPFWVLFGYQTYESWFNSQCVLLKLEDNTWTCLNHDKDCTCLSQVPE
jgi:hypothetical protein